MRAPLVTVALFALPLLSGCGSNPQREPEGGSGGAYGGSVGSGSFSASNPAVARFVAQMQKKHGFDPDQLKSVLARTQKQNWIITEMDKQNDKPARKITAPSAPTGAWLRYKAKFVTPDNIAKGVDFWRQYGADLQRASATYGVPPEIMVGIIGVETRWGRIMGKTRIIDALATLSFAYPRRSDYFSGELENFLVMARDEGFDPFGPRGSFAGAMGYGQFMPTAFHDYAVDFGGDGRRDLWNPVDAIGSVANYFHGHGWQTGQPIAVRAAVSGSGAAGLKTGFDTKYSLSELAAQGISPAAPVGSASSASLLKLDVGTGYDYWLGLPNFYVITRYNHSTYYAMAVYQLGQAVKARVMGGGQMAGSGEPMPYLGTARLASNTQDAATRP